MGGLLNHTNPSVPILVKDMQTFSENRRVADLRYLFRSRYLISGFEARASKRIESMRATIVTQALLPVLGLSCPSAQLTSAWGGVSFVLFISALGGFT